jgi:glycosyltransferase involved in cell wall biosynthesis
VLLFGNHPPPYGGVPTHVQDLAGHLAGRGWRVHVLAMEGLRRDPEFAAGYTIHRPGRSERLTALRRILSSDPAFLTRQAVRFPGFLTGNPKMFFGCLSLAAVVRDLVRRHDLRLISAYHLFSAGLASAWAADSLGIPLITTMFGEIYARPDFHRRRLREVRHVVEASRVLLSCSHHCARSLQLLGIAAPVQVIHYGVNTESFSPEVDPAPIRVRHGLTPDDHVVLYVARMVREMGLHVLLAAVDRLLAGDAGIKVVIVGSSGELRAEAEAHALRHQGRVIVVPDVPQQELPHYYAAATVAVSPSINERACLGLAVAEAMSTARAVVVTNVGGGPELVSDQVNGLLVPAGDPRALADAVLALTRDEARRRDMAASGLEVARRAFDRSVTNRSMEELFVEAMG